MTQPSMSQEEIRTMITKFGKARGIVPPDSNDRVYPRKVNIVKGIPRFG